MARDDDAGVASALAGAGVAESAVYAVFMTGGTLCVPAVRRLFETRFAAGRIHHGTRCSPWRPGSR